MTSAPLSIAYWIPAMMAEVGQLLVVDVDE